MCIRDRIQRAGAELARMRQVYAVAPRSGLDPELADEMALCAIADAMYEFAQEDEARGLEKVSVGSISETYTAPAQLCAATLAVAPSDITFYQMCIRDRCAAGSRSACRCRGTSRTS